MGRSATLEHDAQRLHGLYARTSISPPSTALRDIGGNIVPASGDRAVYSDALQRTFLLSALVTALCLLLGFPIAYLLATLPLRHSNLLMILVLLPFWTSLLVRTTAWIVILQRQGVVNEARCSARHHRSSSRWSSCTTAGRLHRHDPHPAAVHGAAALRVMRGIPPLRARAALARRHPAGRLPPGLPAADPAGRRRRRLLVFILAVGYYITPALVGGAGRPDDQLLDRLPPLQTLNWGWRRRWRAAAAATFVLSLVYDRLVGIDRLKLG